MVFMDTTATIPTGARGTLAVFGFHDLRLLQSVTFMYPLFG